MAKVVVDRKVLRNFVRRAIRRYPNEYMELAYGKINGSSVSIHIFVPMKHGASKKRIYYDGEDMEQSQELLEGEGLMFLGSIHTHPDAAPRPSDSDLASAIQDGETIMGICEISGKERKRKRTYVEFWPALRPLDKELIG